MSQPLVKRFSALLVSFVFIFSLIFAPLLTPRVSHADEAGVFKVSEYGSNVITTGGAFWRGYLFQVSEETTVTHLIGGGTYRTTNNGAPAGGPPGYVFDVAIFKATFNGTTVTLNGAPLGYVTPNSPDPQQVVALGTSIELLPPLSDPQTPQEYNYYVLAQGRTRATSGVNPADGIHYNLGLVERDSILTAPRIQSWFPATDSSAFQWNQVTPATSLSGDNSQISTDVMPAIGFLYESSLESLPEITTGDVSLDNESVEATVNGIITDNGGGEVTYGMRWVYENEAGLNGHQATLIWSDDKLPADYDFEEDGPFEYGFAIDLDENGPGTYYYKAVASNDLGLTEGSPESFTVHYLNYEVDEDSEDMGSITGDDFQLVFDEGDGATVTAVANPGYIFKYWVNDDTDEKILTNAITHIGVDESVYYIAHFRPSYDYFASGNGSQENPYIINTCEQLQKINDIADTDGIYFKLNQDITCDSPDWESIEDGNNSFRGNFDGNGKTISGLKKSLFNVIYDGGSIQNLHLKDVNITHNENGFYAGALARMAYGTSVFRVSATGSVSGSGECGSIGGLVGLLSNSSVEESWADVEVSAGDCEEVGGFVGWMSDTSEILNAYARGNVTGDKETGGFVGLIQDSVIISAYSTGKVLGDGEDVGGFVGKREGSTILVSLWDMTVQESEMLDALEENNIPDQVIAATSAQMKNVSTFMDPSFEDFGWDFVSVWMIDNAGVKNDGYPYFKWQTFGTSPTPPNNNNNSRGSSRASGSISTQQSSIVTIQSIIAEHRDLLLQAYKMGIPLPQIILDLLDIGSDTASSPNILVRDLQVGDRGDDVKMLQNLLIAQGYPIPAGATGIFANQTKSALVAYQSANGIAPASGRLGSVTRAKMKAAGLPGIWW